MCVSVLCTRCLVWLCAALLGISQASKEVSLSLTHSVTHSLTRSVSSVYMSTIHYTTLRIYGIMCTD